MLLTLRTTHEPATDLGHLLRKHPERTREVALPFGTAHVFWPEAGEHAATVALFVDVDPVALVRGRRGSPTDGPLAMYVNDRPYVASSFLSVALARTFRSAMAGKAVERAELVDQPLPLEVELPAVRVRGGRGLLTNLFEPLGYAVQATLQPLDETRPEWGEGSLFHLRLAATLPVRQVLQHLYVLLPVLDDDKHYWVGQDEVDKLLGRGAEWLPGHPHKELVARRYLKHRGALTRRALAELTEAEPEPDGPPGVDEAEEAVEAPIKLQTRRMARVCELLTEAQATRIVDLGCGEGRLVRRLAQDARVTEVLGVDPSSRALELAEKRLERQPDKARAKVRLLHGSAVYRDSRLDGYDAITLVEVIEHIDEERLDALAASVFGGCKPPLVIVTTPNVEHNVRFESLPAGRLRHRDHRFEWTRAEFSAWAGHVAERYGYTAHIEGIGPDDAEVGPPTQLGVFRCS